MSPHSFMVNALDHCVKRPLKMTQELFVALELSQKKIRQMKIWMYLNDYMHIIVHPHILVRATSEQFPPARVTFRSVSAKESHWLQPLLVLTICWCPDTSKCGHAISFEP